VPPCGRQPDHDDNGKTALTRVEEVALSDLNAQLRRGWMGFPAHSLAGTPRERTTFALTGGRKKGKGLRIHGPNAAPAPVVDRGKQHQPCLTLAGRTTGQSSPRSKGSLTPARKLPPLKGQAFSKHDFGASVRFLLHSGQIASAAEWKWQKPQEALDEAMSVDTE